MDIALLLPPVPMQSSTSLMLSPARFALEAALGRTVDLLSARDSSTVFQKEIVTSGRRLDCQDENAAAEFEFMTLSLYQNLNDERAEILADFERTGASLRSMNDIVTRRIQSI